MKDLKTFAGLTIAAIALLLALTGVAAISPLQSPVSPLPTPTTEPTATGEPTANYHNLARVLAVDEYGQEVDDETGLNIVVLPSPIGVQVLKRLVTTGPLYVGSEVQFSIIVTNVGLSALDTVALNDVYDTAILEYQSASVEPASASDGAIVWEAGPLAAGEAIEIIVTFVAVGVTG